MSASERSAQASQISRLLRELLQSRPDYRRQWQEKTERLRSGAISKAGVAKVIALYLWNTGERADSETTLPRDLKDRIRRALTGEGITPQTLDWFVRAFGMDEHDERSLWAALANDMDLRTGISHTLTTDRELALRQRHRTIALFERYTIAADRSFATRRALHTIMALEDGVDVYPFNHEPAVERIEVVFGGTLGRRYLHGNGLHTDAIFLDRNLRTGETTSLEYLAYYPPGGYLATEIRRPAHGRSENVDIAVQFSEAALPAAVYWAIWCDHHDGAPVREEPVVLQGQRSVRRFLHFIEETVVGFRWQW
jgi:hypothetical protein